jgi:hypothetical protein
MKYLLNLHADHLTHLVSVWQPKVILLSEAVEMPESWGPTDEELVRMQQYEIHKSTEEYSGGHNDDGGDNDDWSNDEISDDEISDDEDMGLLEAIEEADLTGETFDKDDLNNELFEIAGLSYIPSRSNSPRKHFTSM